ncbi:hypothetical protein [Mesonia sp. K4-1]|uniref:hypothetical protein n=1 Tax=Mesonia sp. K4-1 TaxID=2602760 RepID=UPI0011C7ED80|nr:hypothetical protein [Mesonia sp. K4-1]TXK75777.1 hypothetical protein FT986_09740 [Mesonia sp. K4-1]
MTSKSVKTEVFYNKKENKKLVTFPMVHLNHQEFYDDVKYKLDSLRKQNYTIFYESVKLDTTLYSKKEIDTFKMKARKLMGFHLTAYNDKENKSLPKALRNSKYANQTHKNIGLTKTDIKIDLPLDTLLQVFELKYNKIKLGPCDYLTGLKQEYNCQQVSSFKRDDVIMSIRNQYIEYKVLNSPYNKIALVYGKNHFKELNESFKKKGYKHLKEYK